MQAIHARASVDGVTTLLSGARGNLNFSADGPEWLASLVRSGRIGTAVREAATWAKVSGEGVYRTLGGRLVYPLLPGVLQRLARAATGRTELIQRWSAAVALRPEIVMDLDLAARIPVLNQRRPDMRTVALYVAQGGASQAGDGSATAALTGVEERDATADRRVLEVAMRQPEWVRRHDGVTRAVVRGAMADRLPAEIVQRTRRGEQLPDWLDLMTAARAVLASELEQLQDHATSARLIDTARLQGLMNRWPDRTTRADPEVVRDYRLALLRALVVSRYLRWFEGRAAATASGSA